MVKCVQTIAATKEALHVHVRQVKRQKPVLVERIKGQVTDQMVDILVPLDMDESWHSCARNRGVCPIGTSATSDRRACAGASDSGRDQ